MLRQNKRSLKSAAVLSAILMNAVYGCAQEVPSGGPASYAPVQYAPPPGADLPPAQSSSNWPLVVESGGDEVIMYQPQLESFQGDTITARAAVSVKHDAQQEPIFGVAWIQSRVSTDRNARTVQILDVNITRSRFPEAPPADQQALTDALRQRLADHPKVLSLDQLLKMVELVDKEKIADEQLVNNPPKIIFLQHPAVKVQYDGAPRLMKVDQSALMRVVNTPFFVTLDPSTRTYYLKGGGQWFAAPDPLGPFRSINNAPPAVAQFADQSGYKDPAQPLSGPQAAATEIVTATEPTELIWTDGPEEMGTITGTSLLYVTNTGSDVLLDITSQDLYVLLSGRWYTSRDHNGPWTYVAPDKLPPDFARIPPGSAKGAVLAHVSGTSAAQDAVADAYIPQTAAIDRNQVERPQVVYDGAPQFQAVEGTPCTYAVNTSYSVIYVNRRYYCCHQAAWYECDRPDGRWDVCVSVPREIYLLPPSCPIYSVKYCHVYGYTPEVVYVGYTPGYVGCYTYDGCVVYGTGYYYRPWVGPTYYYARPCTFGYAAHYEPYQNHWGFEVALGEGHGRSWVGEEREHDHEREVPGGHWFGNGGYQPVVIHNETVINRNVTNINVRNTTINHNEVNVRNTKLVDTHNIYDRRTDVRHDAVARPVAQAGPVRANGGRTTPQVPARDLRDNVYADPQGNVHRKTIDGWQTRQGNKWVPQPAGQTPRDTAAPHPANMPNQPAREIPRETVHAPGQGAPRVNAPGPKEAPQVHQPANEAPRQVVHEPVRQPVNEPTRAPAHEAPRQPANEAPRQPVREAPKQAAPPAGSGSLDQEFHARVAGRDRYQNSPRPAPPPRQEPAPRQEAPPRQEPAPHHEPTPGPSSGGRPSGGGADASRSGPQGGGGNNGGKR